MTEKCYCSSFCCWQSELQMRSAEDEMSSACSCWCCSNEIVMMLAVWGSVFTSSELLLLQSLWTSQFAMCVCLCVLSGFAFAIVATLPACQPAFDASWELSSVSFSVLLCSVCSFHLPSIFPFICTRFSSFPMCSSAFQSYSVFAIIANVFRLPAFLPPFQSIFPDWWTWSTPSSSSSMIRPYLLKASLATIVHPAMPSLHYHQLKTHE